MPPQEASLDCWALGSVLPLLPYLLPPPSPPPPWLATGFLPDYIVQVEAVLPGLWNAGLAWIPNHVQPLKPSLLSQAAHFSSPLSPRQLLW